MEDEVTALAAEFRRVLGLRPDSEEWLERVWQACWAEHTRAVAARIRRRAAEERLAEPGRAAGAAAALVASLSQEQRAALEAALKGGAP